MCRNLRRKSFVLGDVYIRRWRDGLKLMDGLVGEIVLRIIVPGATKLETNLQKFGICCMNLHGRDQMRHYEVIQCAQARAS